MKQITLFFLTFLFISAVKGQTSQDKEKPLTIGEVVTMYSDVLKEERTLNIYLPETYDRAKAYPVLYLLDGSMDEDFLHITGLAQFFNLMFSMPDFIIVGIANVNRKRDFTFHTDLEDLQKQYPTTGHSAAFISFVESELQPMIQARYKITEDKYLIGQSLGGLLATEILLKKAYLFSHYLIVSPSLWWDNESMLNEAETLFAQQPDTDRYVFVAVGAHEDKIMQREALALSEMLQRSKKKQLKTDFLSMEDENHASILHNCIYEAFLKLFPYKD